MKARNGEKSHTSDKSQNGTKPAGGTSDILQSRTFLEVVAHGSFGRAAERLDLSQAAVSLRIQALETQIGAKLFDRGRGGARLTAAGHKFHRYAQSMKQVWDQAMLDVALPEGFEDQIRLGGHYSLWRNYLVRWLGWMRENAPTHALRAEAHGSEMLLRLLGDGMLDVGVMFDPQHMNGFTIEPLFTETLVLVSTRPDTGGPADPDYVFVDWGPGFQKFHLAEYPDISLSGRQTNLGAFAVDSVLALGGSGYFPEPVVAGPVAEERLFRVESAAPFDTPIYAVFPDTAPPKGLELALQGLRTMAAG